MKVSAIICTLDKGRILPQTIPSIRKSPLVDELTIVEGLKPVGYSRDVGWRKAQNQLICFIDDDEVVPEGWIERLSKEFDDLKVGAVWSTLRPLNPNRVNKLEIIVQNHTLKTLALQARFVRKVALEDVGGYEHIASGETVYAAQKLVQHGWKIKILDYPLLHRMHSNWYAWILNISGTGRIRASELARAPKMLLVYYKKAVGSFLSGVQLSMLYKEPLLFLFYPLRCWLYLLGIIEGNLRPRKTRSCEY